MHSAVNKPNRWALLKHIDAPDDINRIHFDLLLEDGIACRTWRLDQVPVLNGQVVTAICSPLHKLHWLETNDSPVSRGRGWVERIEGGFFKGNLPSSLDSPIEIELLSKTISGLLEINKGFCRIRSGKSKSYKSP